MLERFRVLDRCAYWCQKPKTRNDIFRRGKLLREVKTTLVDRKMVGKDIYCTECDELIEVAIEWHGVVEFGKNQRDVGGLVLCRKCAQHLMRILLEDIIAYDNGVHVSLSNIMYHGQKGRYNLLEENKDLRFARFTPRRLV